MARSWREVDQKVAELRTETFDAIAEIVLDLEEKVEDLEAHNASLRERIAELGGEV